MNNDGKKPFTFTLFKNNGKLVTMKDIIFVEDTKKAGIIFNLEKEKMTVTK